jgi:hypothetical protein
VLHIRPALRDRAPSVRGIRHVLSERARDALAPRTPSADDRAVHGTAGLRVAAGVIPSNSGLICVALGERKPSAIRSIPMPFGVETGTNLPLTGAAVSRHFTPGASRSPAAGESVRRTLRGAFTVG